MEARGLRGPEAEEPIGEESGYGGSGEANLVIDEEGENVPNPMNNAQAGDSGFGGSREERR